MTGTRGSKIVTRNPRRPHLQEDDLTRWDPKGGPAYAMAHANSLLPEHTCSQRPLSHLLCCELGSRDPASKPVS